MSEERPLRLRPLALSRLSRASALARGVARARAHPASLSQVGAAWLQASWFPRWTTTAIAVSVAVLAASCLGPGTTQSVRYYVLSPVAASQPVEAKHKRMGVLPVRLPGYLDRPALIERRGAEIFPHAFSAWAAPLDQEFARVLAENLQRSHPGYEVAVFPWRRSFAPDQRLDIDVVRFEVENGAAVLHARWRVLGANGDGVTAVSESRIQVPVAQEDDPARVAALSAALGRLSAEVAGALGQGLGASSTALGR